jgi:hypothetical protein
MPVVLTDQWDFFFIIKYTDNSLCTITTLGINLRKDLNWHFITNQSRRTYTLVQA